MDGAKVNSPTNQHHLNFTEQLRQHLPRRPLENPVIACCPGRFGVDFDTVGTGLSRKVGKTRSGPDGSGGADTDKQITVSDGLGSLAHDNRIKHVAEPDDVWPEPVSAVTAGCFELLPVIFFFETAALAPKTPEAAMQLDNLFRSCPLVHAVDILGHHTGVGYTGNHPVPFMREAIEYATAALFMETKNLFGVTVESLLAGILLNTVRPPDSSFAPVSRHPAFSRHARTGKKEDMFVRCRINVLRHKFNAFGFNEVTLGNVS